MTDSIDYIGKVYVYSSEMSEDIIKARKQKLQEFGVKLNDIVIIGLPEGVPEGSIYAPQLFNIDL